MKKFVVLIISLLSVAITFAQGYKPGDKATDFSLKNTVDGKMVSLKNYPDAKGVVVVFTCNHSFLNKCRELIKIISRHFKWIVFSYA